MIIIELKLFLFNYETVKMGIEVLSVRPDGVNNVTEKKDITHYSGLDGKPNTLTLEEADALMSDLGLSEEQKTNILEILLEADPDAEEIDINLFKSLLDLDDDDVIEAQELKAVANAEDIEIEAVGEDVKIKRMSIVSDDKKTGLPDNDFSRSSVPIEEILDVGNGRRPLKLDEGGINRIRESLTRRFEGADPDVINAVLEIIVSVGVSHKNQIYAKNLNGILSYLTEGKDIGKTIDIDKLNLLHAAKGGFTNTDGHPENLTLSRRDALSLFMDGDDINENDMYNVLRMIGVESDTAEDYRHYYRNNPLNEGLFENNKLDASHVDHWKEGLFDDGEIYNADGVKFSEDDIHQISHYFTENGDADQEALEGLLYDVVNPDDGSFRGDTQKLNTLLLVLSALDMPNEIVINIKDIMMSGKAADNALRRTIVQDIANTAGIAHETNDAETIEAETEAFATLFDDGPLPIDYGLDTGGINQKMRDTQNSDKFQNANWENRQRILQRDVLEPINRSELSDGTTIGELAGGLASVVFEDISSSESVQAAFETVKTIIEETVAEEAPGDEAKQAALVDQIMTSVMNIFVSFVANAPFENGEERKNLILGMADFIKNSGDEKQELHEQFLLGVATADNSAELFDRRTGGDVYEEVKAGDFNALTDKYAQPGDVDIFWDWQGPANNSDYFLGDNLWHIAKKGVLTAPRKTTALEVFRNTLGFIASFSIIGPALEAAVYAATGDKARAKATISDPLGWGLSVGLGAVMMIPGVGQAVGAVGTAVAQGIKQGVKQGATAAARIVGKAATKAGGAIKSAAKGVMKRGAGTMDELPELVIRSVDDLGESAVVAAKPKTLAGNKITKARELLGRAGTAIKDAAINAGKAASDLADDIIGKAKIFSEGVKQAYEEVVKMLIKRGVSPEQALKQGRKAVEKITNEHAEKLAKAAGHKGNNLIQETAIKAYKAIKNMWRHSGAPKEMAEKKAVESVMEHTGQSAFQRALDAGESFKEAIGQGLESVKNAAVGIAKQTGAAANDIMKQGLVNYIRRQAIAYGPHILNQARNLEEGATKLFNDLTDMFKKAGLSGKAAQKEASAGVGEELWKKASAETLETTGKKGFGEIAEKVGTGLKGLGEDAITGIQAASSMAASAALSAAKAAGSLGKQAIGKIVEQARSFATIAAENAGVAKDKVLSIAQEAAEKARTQAQNAWQKFRKGADNAGGTVKEAAVSTGEELWRKGALEILEMTNWKKASVEIFKMTEKEGLEAVGKIAEKVGTGLRGLETHVIKKSLRDASKEALKAAIEGIESFGRKAADKIVKQARDFAKIAAEKAELPKDIVLQMADEAENNAGRALLGFPID